MNLLALAGQIDAGKFQPHLENHLPAETISRLHEMNVEGIDNQLKQVIRNPIDLTGEMSKDLLELYYTASWFNLFEILRVPPDAAVFEIAAGDTIYIPRALNAYSGNTTNATNATNATYVTANLNKELSKGFFQKTADLDIQIKIIEDDGVNLLDYYEHDSFEVVSFHHALNDIIQTIIADIEGIDTVNNNWWTIEPQMLQAVMRYNDQGKLKEAAYEPFIKIIDTCTKLLKKGGYIIFDNCTYAGYEQIGYSSEFHSSYIRLAREWITEANLDLEEVELDLYDKNWWMILKKL
ncbi:hypothetical protein [Paenibacillus eucommiae]|uniref:Class I SAM-dependent methyltransferase n=1 Tax=Paenibacillus eucommiae TaxID=1355755 RepID=A0ABS4J1E2_9BACL|nr:hypothetical protein [Paenibacillus eucommiae]MBP1993648.1 hypothetical protein [Paenibacillus eucommiae]